MMLRRCRKKPSVKNVQVIRAHGYPNKNPMFLVTNIQVVVTNIKVRA